MKIDLTKLYGLNWYKYGAVAVALVAMVALSYCSGKYNAKLECEAAKTEQAEEKVRTIIKEIEVRIPVIQTREVESAKARAEIARLNKELQDAINDRPENPSCDLSDAEFNGFRKLSEKTRK